MSHRWFGWILAFVIISCLVSYSNCQSKRKDGQSLNDKVHNLMDMNMRRSVIKLNSEKFKLYVKAMPKNYSVIVMLTALADNRQCHMCRLASEEFQLVANSWRYSQLYSSRLFFAMIDYDEAPDIFSSLRKSSVPVFLHFPAKGKLKKEDEMPIQTQGFHAEAIAKWVAERTDFQIRVFRPPSYAGTIALVILFSMIAALLYLRRSNLDFLYNRSMWAIAALVIVFIFTSGQMWNHIRGPPFMQKTREGNVQYIYGSSSGQFVIESYFVMFMYACVAFGMVMVTDAAAVEGGDIKKRRIMAVIGVGLIAIFYGLILSVFRNKAGGYPYSFIFK